MKNKWLMIFLFIIILFLIVFAISSIIKLDYPMIDNYFIHYYDNSYYVYDIETKRNGMYVNKSEVVNCITDPCEPILKKRYKVKYKDEYIDFIKELFKDKEVNKITIQDKDLNSNQIIILSKIIEEN